MNRFSTKTFLVGAVGSALLTLQGCGTTLLSSRSTNPVIQDFAHRWLSNDSTLSTTASRRLALMSYKKNADGRMTLITCAEPPPDVGETFAKALAAQLEISAPKAAGDVQLGFGFTESVATAIAPLMIRTQGLQILRDSAFTLCVDYMNGWIADSETYMKIKADRFDKAIALIEKELPNLPARLTPPQSPLSAPTLPQPTPMPLPSGNPASTPK